MSVTGSPTVETTVGELVAQRPSRSRVFERLGIDYCCGGKKPLSAACAARGLDADTVLTTLLAAEEGSSADEPNWTRTSLTELADNIEQSHHAYLKRELPRLGAMVRKVAAVHGRHHPWLDEIHHVYDHFAADMESHLMKEEQVLFPRIRSLESGKPAPDAGCGAGVDTPIRAMEHEHDDAAEQLARLRELSDEFTPPPDACNTFRAVLDGLRELEADTHRHIHKENSILFPRAQELERQHASSARA
jgi:regulator of cell morphogenesis and NO signaling